MHTIYALCSTAEFNRDPAIAIDNACADGSYFFMDYSVAEHYALELSEQDKEPFMILAFNLDMDNLKQVAIEVSVKDYNYMTDSL